MGVHADRRARAAVAEMGLVVVLVALSAESWAARVARRSLPPGRLHSPATSARDISTRTIDPDLLAWALIVWLLYACSMAQTRGSG